MPLQVLRSKTLPPILTSFRSLQDTISAGVDVRLSTISRMNGYPSPSHVVARIYKYLDFNSISSLKSGILKLRDITRFASDILATIPQVKVGRYQLERTAITDYIEDNKSSYGYDILTESDIDLVTFLVTSSEMIEATWSLDLSAVPDANNPLLMIGQLYDGLRIPIAYKISQDAKKKVSIAFEGDTVPSIYVSSTDQIMPLTQLPSLAYAMTVRAKTSSSEKPDDILTREDTLLRLSDLRLLDHMLSLITNPDVWTAFVPPRTKDDASANEERVKGLRLFSGYLHSLLLIPHFFRLELFRQSYMQFEDWLRNFPVVPEDIERNYNETIRKYDVFNSAQDAADIFSLYHDKDAAIRSEIKTLFTEFVSTFGLDALLSKASRASVTDAQIQLTDLSQLRDNKFNYVMLSHPIGKYEMTYDLFQHLFDADVFRQNMNDAFSAVIPVVGKYLQDSIVDKLQSLSFRPIIPFHPPLPGSLEYRSGIVPVIEHNSYVHDYSAVSADYETERKLRTDLLYNVLNIRRLKQQFSPKCMFDMDIASKLREMLGRDWRTLYPSAIVAGDRSIDPRVIKTSEIDLKQLLEQISGEHFEVIRRSFSTQYNREIWATVLSSFCLIFEVVNSDVISPASGKEAKDSIRSLDEFATVQAGLGHPYGKTYEGLAAMQDFQDTDLIPVTESIYIAMLKKVPMPSTSIGVSTFTLNTPYYYFGGNGMTVDVDRFVYGEAMLQFALRPISPNISIPTVLFDRIYAYINDTLVLQADISLRLNSSVEGKFKLPLPITTAPWKNDRFSPLLEYVKISSYGKLSQGAIASDESMIGSIMEELDKELVKTDSETPVKKEEETKTDLNVKVDETSSPQKKDTSSKNQTKKKKNEKDSSDSDEVNLSDKDEERAEL